ETALNRLRRSARYAASGLSFRGPGETITKTSHSPETITMHRRNFLQAGAAGLFAALNTETSRGFGANDTLNVACIGTGGRCRTLMESLRKVPNVRLAAVCDIWDYALAAGAKIADSKAVQSREFRKLLDRKDIDAVLIGSPDHWHVPMAVAA